MNGNSDNNLNFLMGTQGNYGYPNQGMDPMMGGQNMYGQNPYAGNNYGAPQGGLDFLMGGPGGNANPSMEFNGNMGQSNMPQSNLDPFLGPNNNNNDEKGETLFGVPMYDEKKEEKKPVDESNLFAPDPNSFAPQQPYGYPGMPMSNDYGLGNMPPIIHNDNMDMQPANETLFGAPMYDTPSSNQMDPSNGNRTDIFGQLLTPEGNMRIKGGRIVDDFSKVNIPPQDGNLIQAMNQPYGYQNPGMDPMMGGQNMYGQGPYGNMGMNPNQYMNNNQFGMNQNYGMGMNNQFGMNQNYNMGMNNQFGMNPNQYMNNNQFGMNQNYGMGMNMYPGYGMPRGPVFNELKVEDNLNQNIIKEPPEEEREEKPRPVEKPTPRVDLNLETGSEDKEEFYD